MRLQLVVMSVLLAPLLLAQSAVRTRYIPALAYGPNVWSIVRLTNSGATRQSVRVEAYREDGTALAIGPMYDVEPGAMMDVRIDGKIAEPEMCWARVTLPEGVEARGFVEILEGNSLEDFPREPHEVSGSERWVTFATSVQGKQFYFLNASDQATVVAFCGAKQAPPNACAKSGSASKRYRVGPKGSVSVQVRKLRQRLFITESSMPGAAVVALFDNGPGIRKVFGSKSSIEFGDALP